MPELLIFAIHGLRPGVSPRQNPEQAVSLSKSRKSRKDRFLQGSKTPFIPGISRQGLRQDVWRQSANTGRLLSPQFLSSSFRYQLLFMKYNTERRPLVYPEYGRGIQDMVDFTINIPSKVARNRASETILRFMQVLNPQVRELDDYMHKLYDQLIIMSDFKLDIDNPYPAPEKESETRKAKPFQYHPARIRFRYYGKTLESMIRKATEMPDGKGKDMVLNLITVQMKKSYYLWNDDILSDAMVAEHLDILSNGKLKYTEAMKGEVYSTFYNKPSLERKNKYINVSAYENSGRRPYNNNNNSYGNRNYNNANNHRYHNKDDNHAFQPNPNRYKKRRLF